MLAEGDLKELFMGGLLQTFQEFFGPISVLRERFKLGIDSQSTSFLFGQFPSISRPRPCTIKSSPSLPPSSHYSSPSCPAS